MFDRRGALATGLIGTTAMLAPATLTAATTGATPGGQAPGFYRLKVGGIEVDPGA